MNAASLCIDTVGSAGWLCSGRPPCRPSCGFDIPTGRGAGRFYESPSLVNAILVPFATIGSSGAARFSPGGVRPREGPAVRSPRRGAVLDGFWRTPYPHPTGQREPKHYPRTVGIPILLSEHLPIRRDSPSGCFESAMTAPSTNESATGEPKRPSSPSSRHRDQRFPHTNAQAACEDGFIS